MLLTDAMKAQINNVPASVQKDLKIKKDRIRILNEQLTKLEKDKRTMQVSNIIQDRFRLYSIA